MRRTIERVWRRVRRNADHPKVREERLKALGAVSHNGGLALIVGAGAAPFLNPSMEPDLWVRVAFFVLGLGLMVVGQVLLCYILPEETRDE